MNDDVQTITVTREDAVKASLAETWPGNEAVTFTLGLIAVELARQNDLLAVLYELQREV